MSERPTNEEREAMIAGERAGELGPEARAELGLLADLLADPSTWAEPSADLEGSVVHAVAEASPTSRAARIATGPGPKVPRRRRALLSAVAAAAAVMAVIGVFAANGGTGTDFSAQMSGTALAPRAQGSAAVTRDDSGFRIVLDARGLPVLSPGEYYQAWLKDAAGTLVPVGTFSSSNDRVTLWSGVSPERFPTLTVTIETADNDQSSSGRRVLVGTVHES